MANNRIYLRCRGCGEVLYLGKSYLGGYYYQNHSGSSLVELLNEFYDAHNYCGRSKVSGNTAYDEKAFPLPEDCDGCDGSFDIVYENVWGTGFEPKGG